ncbi:hypothetical protein FQA39_LY01791 [Lamprigera yunnana]|nr:hypothetical protein FQA39_LY01791 [Lamprigera yunnana]
MILFRFLVGVVIWLVLIGVVLACIIGTIYLWILWKQSKSASDDGKPVTGVLGTRRTGSYLAFAIIATIVTICVLLIVLVLRKRVKLVIQMFKEAGKAIGSMPLVLLQPVWTFICIAIALGLWLYFTLWIESSGQKKRIRDDHYILEKDTLMIFTRFYNIFITLWLLQFLIGCQHMVIAGAIACWYFTRNKNHVKGPIAYGFYNLTRYHLGSVSFGSLVIAIIQMLRILLKMLETYLSSHNGKCASCLVKCCQCCLCCFESILKYLTRNAYIEIAIHGYNFCQAGKQAFKILTSNALRVGTINSVGDFVLFLGKVLVVVVTVLIGIELIQKKEGVLHSWVPLTFCGLIAYFISHCFLSVYEMAIDTIFICFCEDCEVNDGVSKPYYMSRSLMQFVENSNKSVLKSSMNNQAGQKGLVCALGYCMANGDIERLTVGYDSCGNVCGKINKITYNFDTDCTAANMIDRPYFDVHRKICVATCVNTVGRKCFSGMEIPNMGLEMIAQDLHICSGELIGLSFLALGFSLIFLLILRYLTAAFVWTAIGGIVVAAISVTGFLWYMTGTSDVYTTEAIVASIFTLILILIIIFLRKRIELVIQLLKEAGKAISSMPLIIFEPLLTLIALGVAITTWIYFTLWIESAGVPVMNEIIGKVTFHQNGLIKFCRWYNLFIMLWTVQFIYGCQNMLLAGAVSIWYFTRNKAIMYSPVLRSATTMLKVHLGTISCGSLIVGLIQILRIVLLRLRQFICYPLFLCGMCSPYSYN